MHELKLQMWGVINPIESNDPEMTWATWISYGNRCTTYRSIVHPGPFLLFQNLSCSSIHHWNEAVSQYPYRLWCMTQFERRLELLWHRADLLLGGDFNKNHDKAIDESSTSEKVVPLIFFPPLCKKLNFMGQKRYIEARILAK